MRIAFHFFTAGTVTPYSVTASAIVIDLNDGSAAKIIAVHARVITMVPYSMIRDIPAGREIPVVIRRCIASDIDVDAEAWPQRRPSVIIITASPGYPGGSPFIVGDPEPTFIVVVVPAPVVERCPAPFIIRIPGPFIIIGPDPVTVISIRSEITADIRTPDFPVTRMVEPPPVRGEFAVEHIEIHRHAHLCSGLLRHKGHTHEQQGQHRK